MAAIRFTLNGKAVTVDDVDPHMSVLHFLRNRGLTGTKEGCAEGECGACAVAVVTRDTEGRAHYAPVNSCLLLVGAMADRELVSVEGVAAMTEAGGETLHPVQQAMVDLGGSQCGYCTPGFVISLFSEYYRPGREGVDLESIAGNLCRCTGYRPIREAAAGMGTPSSTDPHLIPLGRPGTKLTPVSHQTDTGAFHRPTTLPELFHTLAAHPTAKLVAGGTDLVVEINQRHRRFDRIVSLEALPELREFAWTDTHLVLGAGLSLTEVEAKTHGKVPLLDALFPLFSSRLIRNRATLGGNIANASPIGDGPPVLLALDAEVDIASEKGTRTVSLASFFLDYRKTVLAPGEILLRVRIPLPLPEVSRFYKVSKRTLDDISTVAAAFALTFAADDTIRTARFAYGGVAATPARATAAEAAVIGKPWTAQTAAIAKQAALTSFRPMDDHRGTAAYRAAMVGELVAKFAAETITP